MCLEEKYRITSVVLELEKLMKPASKRSGQIILAIILIFRWSLRLIVNVQQAELIETCQIYAIYTHVFGDN